MHTTTCPSRVSRDLFSSLSSGFRVHVVFIPGCLLCWKIFNPFHLPYPIATAISVSASWSRISGEARKQLRPGNSLCSYFSFLSFLSFCCLHFDSFFSYFKEGIVYVTSDWARIYFMVFYVATMVSQLVFAL